MPGEKLVCVWEAAYAIDQNPGLQLKQADLKVVTLSFAHLPGVCVQLSAKKFDELFPDEVVDFQAYKNFVQFRLLEKGTLLSALEEEIEKVCWTKCKNKYVECKWRVSSTETFHLWQMFVRLAEENTYPPMMLPGEVEWLVEKMSTALGRGWKQPDIGDGVTFKQMMSILESHVFEGQTVAEIKKAVEELHNWMVLEICQAGWLIKRTRKAANWTNWVKRWFILTPVKLLYYDGPSKKNLKGQVNVTSSSIIESLPDYKGFARTLKNRFKIDNSPHLEIELCALDSNDKAMWIGSLKEVADASNIGMTPVQALINARRQHKKESFSDTERQIEKFQKTARRIQAAKENEEKGDKEPLTVLKKKGTPVVKGLKNTTPANKTGANQSEKEYFDNNMIAYQKDKMKKVFLQIDSDGNGKISLEEFTRFVKGLGIQMGENEIKLLFLTVDRNRSGFISLKDFEEYFANFIMDETNHGELESKLRSAFLKADRDGTGTIDFKEFTEFAWEKRRSITVTQLLQYFGNMDEGTGEVSFEQFRSFFRNQHSMMDIIQEEEEEDSSEKKADVILEEKLKSLYLNADVSDLGDYLRKRWEVFASFKRLGASGEVVMEGASGMVSDVVPGEYSLVDLACFNDLPPITPKHAVIKNFEWVSAKGKSGRAIFPAEFDGKLPIEIATQEHLSYYGASLAESNQVKVSLLYRHGIQDFTYQNQYLEDYVTNKNALGGAGIEKHEFSHLDCPLDDDSGFFILGKVDGNEIHLTAFKVPTRHTLYVPGGTIHSNDYLKGTWRTMLSDEAEIDHVQLCKRSKSGDEKEFEKFVFEFVDKF
jgi:Ca2+-binding EF-hand superfamily protein